VLLDVAVDQCRPLTFNLAGVRAGQPRHEWHQPLPLSIARRIVKLHGQRADRARETARHAVHGRNGSVLEATRNQGRFVDARPAIWAREWMRARLELPIQDVIEIIHGGLPPYHPSNVMLRPQITPVNGEGRQV
jgi:hypothetical protein